ncbi:hypothetical protein [Arthrobacter sp. UYCo732]|uniref:hypothetical protein n=1 Tax=Arthrobacter sp. UYCo732 TaxID=3156336 RepID=UPI00339ACDD5
MEEASTGPYDSEPNQEIRAAAASHGGDTVAAAKARWLEAVDGIPLGQYDKRIVEWAAHMMDQSTLWVFAGLLDRARTSGRSAAE